MANLPAPLESPAAFPPPTEKALLPLRRRYLRRVHSLLHPPRRIVRDPEVSEHELRLARWPAALNGLRVVQISDIHYSLYLHGRLPERAVEMANRLRPDLIALTGDFVTASRQFIEPVGELLGRLRARLGVYAVLGNHDFRVGAEHVARGLRRHGVRVLRNRKRSLALNGARITLAGIDDSRQQPDLRATLGIARAGTDAAARTREFTLLLAHSPAALDDAADLGVDLVLSGHTHGGQIHLKFADRLYDRLWPVGFLGRGETLMYINRGLGQVILPWRHDCPPEIAAFTLRRADCR